MTSSNMQEDDSSALMTPVELATYLGIGRNLAYQLLQEGEIAGFRIKKQWKVSKEAVDRYIAKKSRLI
jgi:excisionase family DNA binding protein